MRIKPTAQVYSHYAVSDFEVWKLLWDRQGAYLPAYASKLYLEALVDIGFTGDEIPDFEKTNKRLMKTTGWQLTVAPELVPDADFFRLLARRVFPATCWLRTMEELDYLEEPDMFHDVFGHAPLLINRHFATFMEAFGKLALQWVHHAEALKMLSAFYWFTVEFGLLYEDDNIKIFGSGIISSVGETQHVLHDQSLKLSFDIHSMMNTPYQTDKVQNQYFLIDSFEQLCDALPEIEEYLNQIFEQKTITKSVAAAG
ncbi:MAG: phenylalanine 4-monooxygenase [Taibaiella sp.]|jgi:phenylalanine-4-hydroxylase